MGRPKKTEEDDGLTKQQRKLVKLCGQTLLDTLDNATPEELSGRLTTLAKHEQETDEAFEKDEEIVKMKEELKEIQAPYKDTLKGIKVQRGYIATLLQSKGSKVSG